MYLCIANHFMTTKMLTARQRVYAPGRAAVSIVIKVIGVAF